MAEDLDARFQALQDSDDVYALIDLGCDLADVGRQADAEWCFRRAADLGDSVASFNLGNALAAQQRFPEAVEAYEVALAAGEPDAWRNLGKVLEDLGDGSTKVTYRLALDVNIPLIGMLKRKGEKILIDTALKGLKKRVESTAP